jgi:competence protein ComEC
MQTSADHRSAAAAARIVSRPLVPLAIALSSGIIAGTHLPGYLVAATILFLFTASGILFCVRCRRNALVLPLLLACAAGYLSIQPWLGRKLPADHVARYAGQAKWQVVGIVEDPTGGSNGQGQFTLQAKQLRRGVQPIAVQGKVRISTSGELGPLQRGDKVSVIGRLTAVRGFCNPDGFVYERHMALQGVHARLYAPAERIRVETVTPVGWKGHLDTLRGRIRARMDTALQEFSAPERQLLYALTIGERTGMDEKLTEAFSRAGVSHVLAISGLHIGIVALAAFAFFSCLLVWIPPLRESGWVSKAAAASTLLPVAGYALLAGMSPSTQRALIMVTAFLMTFFIGRPRDWFTALSLAALVILIVAPPALMSVSFQLSFAAVLTIAIGMSRMPFAIESAAPWPRRWGIRLMSLIVVSVLAIWGTTPLVMRYFNQISWVGPLSNLLVVPLVGTLVVPAGLLGIACAPLGSFISGVCWKTAALSLKLIVAWVEAIAAWDHAAAVTVTPSLPEMVLFYLFTGTVLLWKNRTIRITGLTIVLVAGTVDAVYWVHRRFMAHHMTVTAVDVGQGSANVLQLPKGYIVLVDGGGFSDNNAFDIGRSVLAPYLWANKIRTIDLVILTHPDSDHLNGLLYILQKFKVHRIWSNHEPAPTRGYRQWQEIIAERGIDHVPFDQLPVQHVLGSVQFTILSPPSDFLERRGGASKRDPNHNSLVVRAGLQNISFLFTGDIKADTEKEIMARHAPEQLRSTIFFVPHHGSKSSTTADFVRAVQPTESIIAAGWQNRFKFPHPDVLQRLENAGCRTWRTDNCGAIIVKTDGSDYQVQTCRKICAGDMDKVPPGHRP